MAMGYREKPFDYYDPEQEEWEGHRAAAPVPPISPRAAPPPPGLYPEPDLRYSSRAGIPGTPQEQPFEYYNPKATMVPPGVRGLDAEPGYGMESRGIGRGVPPPPYVNRDPDHLSMSRGAPPNVSYGQGAPVEPGRGRGRYGDGHYDEPDYYDADGRPGYEPRSPRRGRSPRRVMPGRNEDPAYVDGKRRESGYPSRDRYEDPAYYDAHGTKPRYTDGESRSPRPAGRYDDYGTKPRHGDEDEDFRRPGRLPPMPVEPGRGAASYPTHLNHMIGQEEGAGTRGWEMGGTHTVDCGRWRGLILQRWRRHQRPSAPSTPIRCTPLCLLILCMVEPATSTRALSTKRSRTQSDKPTVEKICFGILTSFDQQQLAAGLLVSYSWLCDRNVFHVIEFLCKNRLVEVSNTNDLFNLTSLT